MITASSIENLKTNIDIIEVIGSYIDLKRVGSNYAACCPFHNEKTPSFMVSPSKGLFHCYGCDIGGDAIKFVMEYEKAGFVEAVEKIADMMNFRLEYDSKTPTKKSDTLEKIAAFYHERLLDSRENLAYLHKRGIDDALIARFNLGFCPSTQQNLSFINGNGLDFDELLQNGILGKSANQNPNSGYSNSYSAKSNSYSASQMYARFNDRIIFPIYSPNGKIVGFGGRTLKDGLAKYINSPQTKLFNKSHLLYGYHIAKQAVFQKSQIIITEGYIDTIMLHKIGMNNVVATLGTALTTDHIPLLNKGDPEIIISYDGDNAGIKAAFRASTILAPLSKKGGVVIFPDGADPADMVLAGKLDEVRSLFARPIPFIEFCLQTIASHHDLSNPLAKEDALKEASAFLRTLSPLMQEEYAAFTANLLQIPLHLIGTSAPRARNTRQAAQSVSTQAQIPQAPLESSGDRLERLILRYMLENENLLERALDFIDSRIFIEYKDAFEALCANKLDHPKLVGIALDPLPLRQDGFEAELRIFILRFLELELKAQSDIDKIIKIRQKIIKLKKGELQPI